jgi:hypothetical protein
MWTDVKMVEEIMNEIITNKNRIYILPIDENKPIKVVHENEYPCPVSYQLGFNHSCKYVDQIITEKEITFSCNNIGCEECFLEKKEEKNDEKTN